MPISVQKYIKEKSLYGIVDQKIKAVSTPVTEAQMGNAKNPGSFSDDFMDAEEKSRKGGIDLTGDKMGLQVQSDGQGVEFNFDPAMIEQLQNVSGFTPVIINIQPMITTMSVFLELREPEMASTSG